MSADRHGGSAAALKRFGEKTRNGRLERRRRSSIAVHDVLIDPELGGFAIRCNVRRDRAWPSTVLVSRRITG
jgi:hypothetical protein